MLFLDVSCGFFWGLAYLAAIILGFKNRTFYIPALSICMNFSWEFWVVVSRISRGEFLTVALAIQLLWLIFDVGIILTWQLFRKKERFAHSKDLCCFLCVFILVYFWAFLGSNWELSVFVINLIMSLDFIFRLRLDDSKHTSFFIAVTKLLGTFAATALNGLLYRNAMICWLGGLCLIMDIYYIVLLKKGDIARERV